MDWAIDHEGRKRVKYGEGGRWEKEEEKKGEMEGKG